MNIEAALATVADLRSMKEEIETGIRAIEMLISRQRNTAVSNLSSTRSEAPPTTMSSAQGSVPSRIIRFLEETPNKSYRAEEIAEAIGEASNIKTVRGALARMAKDGKIGKHGRGRYRAKRTLSSSTESSVTVPSAA